MKKHTHFPYTNTYSSMPHNTNRKHNIHHIPYTNIQHTSTPQGYKKPLSNNGRSTTNIPTDPHIVTTTDTKTNMCHIHTSIVSRHLATRGNNKILCTPPPHISSSEEILPASHPSPLSPRHNLFNCTHLHTTLSVLDLWTDPAGVTALLTRWMEKLAGEPQAGRSEFPHQQGSWEWVDNNNINN